MLRLYTAAATLIAPLMPLWLAVRQARGKENRARIRERLGYASRPRPAGTLIWLHAASVGEANALLPLISALRTQHPATQLLLTTGTVTSAMLMAERLPMGVLHQFAPVDTPQAAVRFLSHWQPQIAVFVESELWPNLILQAHAQGVRLALVNARMSARSFARWQLAPHAARQLLGCFACIAAQSEDDATRFRTLGAAHALCTGNLKYDAAPLPVDEPALAVLKTQIGTRPLWLAASTHPGEEMLIASAHVQLKSRFPDLLTLIVPRHPRRGAAIARQLHDMHIARRALHQPITAGTDIYLADTLGELGLFYRLCHIAFLGGSLVVRGGQNPFEAAHLGCVTLLGPHVENFSAMAASMHSANCIIRIADEVALADEVAHLLAAPDKAAALGARAKSWAEAQGGATARTLQSLAPLLPEARTHAA